MPASASTASTATRTRQSTLTRIYPWLIISLSASFLFYKYIMQVFPSIMTSDLMRAFQVHGTGLGNLAAAFFYAYLITQLFVGLLLDRFSPRLLSAAALSVGALGMYIFSHAHNINTACVARALMGAGAAFATVSYMKLTANWFHPSRFAFIGGLLATAAMLGAIFGEAPLALLAHTVGWRESLACCTILGTILAVLFFLLVRDHPPKRLQPGTHDIPQYKLTIRDLLSVLTKPQNWLLMVYSGLAFSPLAVFGGLWGTPFLRTAYALTDTQAASLISLIFFGLAIGSPVLGFLSDYFKARHAIMRTSAIVALISVVIVIYTPALPIWFLSTLLFLFGFATGAFMLAFAIGKELNPLPLMATVVALINTSDAILGAFTEPLIGKILDVRWDHTLLNGAPQFSLGDYHIALSLLPLYLALTLLVVFFIRDKTNVE